MTRFIYTWWFYGIYSFWILIKFTHGNEGLTLEYCMTETFNPECKENEVILMQAARYGQMKIGRCLDGSYGYLGCSADILDQMDQHCSGKRSCNVMVVTIEAQLNCTIPNAFTRYLEAKFTCQKVMQVKPGICDLPLKSGRHSLSSTHTESTCGGESTPWVIQAKPGQRINVSLTDFHWNAVHENLIGCVQRYGYMIDVDEVINICGKTKRNKDILLSEGSTLQIVIDKNAVQNSGFILTFQVSGCPTFESPADTWTKEDNGVVTVGCVHNDNKWKMRCICNYWIGILGKCERVEDLKRADTISPEAESSVFGMQPVIGFSLIGGLFLVVLCIMVTAIIGYFCIRKSKPEQKEYYMAPMTYHPSTTLPGFRIPTQRNANNADTSNQHNTLLLTGVHNQQTLQSNRGHKELIQATSPPHYFVLENKEEGQKEPIYDAVYQNIGDGNSM